MQISEWFLVEHEKAEENFPELPTEAMGGSKSITAPAPPPEDPKAKKDVKKAPKAPAAKGLLLIPGLDPFKWAVTAWNATYMWVIIQIMWHAQIITLWR